MQCQTALRRRKHIELSGQKEFDINSNLTPPKPKEIDNNGKNEEKNTDTERDHGKNTKHSQATGRRPKKTNEDAEKSNQPYNDGLKKFKNIFNKI
jgi:hypothetical protein